MQYLEKRINVNLQKELNFIKFAERVEPNSALSLSFMQFDSFSKSTAIAFMIFYEIAG